jgi:hypothetical protein
MMNSEIIDDQLTPKKYDVVVPSAGNVLRSGCEMYRSAIVLSVEPLVLVSHETDMRWSATVKPEQFATIGRATLWERIKIQRRRKQ